MDTRNMVSKSVSNQTSKIQIFIEINKVISNINFISFLHTSIREPFSVFKIEGDFSTPLSTKSVQALANCAASIIDFRTLWL